jgi:predicted small secreted protein
MIKRILFCIFAAAIMTAVTGCHTARGGGDNVETSVNSLPRSDVPPPP